MIKLKNPVAALRFYSWFFLYQPQYIGVSAVKHSAQFAPKYCMLSILTYAAHLGESFEKNGIPLNKSYNEDAIPPSHLINQSALPTYFVRSGNNYDSDIHPILIKLEEAIKF